MDKKFKCKKCGAELTPQEKRFCNSCRRESERRQGLAVSAAAQMGLAVDDWGFITVPRGFHAVCGDPEIDRGFPTSCGTIYRGVEGITPVFKNDFSSVAYIEGRFTDPDGYGPVRKIIGVVPDTPDPETRPHWTEGKSWEAIRDTLQKDEEGE